MGTAESSVLSLAAEVGFDAAGIAAVSPHERANRVLRRWIDGGGHAGMRWLERHMPLREDIDNILPGARSAVCGAVNYYQDIEPKQRDADRRNGLGTFSIYAHGEDYHAIVDRMLRDFEERLRGVFPGMRSARCVDTRPVSDRTLALRAGVGWLGKNSAVITPQFGSWVFLGSLVTTLDLTPGRPMETLCAGCSRCVDACPTGALDKPFTVDASRCISYLTIEHRGAIDPPLAERMGAAVYGCDTCQSVCPYNDRAIPSKTFDRKLRSALVDMPLDELQRIGDDEFRRLTERSAIRRCRPEGMRRNARIAAGNVRSGRAERAEERILRAEARRRGKGRTPRR